MAIVTVASFAAFANLVVAACKLASGADPVSGLKTLADIATGAKSLDAALRTTGLAAVAAEMARAAEDHARHFTHPGRARDDAIAIFWQVAPAAFADPAATFAAAHLDPALTTDRMVAAIKASPMGRDFTAAPLPESFFRAVAQSTLQVMLNRADTVAALTPALWRESLRNDAAIKEDTVEILALVRELHAIKQTTVHEITLIAMARKISPRVADRDEALRALDAAADLAAEAQTRGEAGSNVDAFVDATLRRLATLTAEGRLDAATTAADTAVEEAEAGLSQLLDAAIRQHLLAFDAEGAARQIVRRLTLEMTDPSALFGTLQREQEAWYQRGRDRGLRLDLEVSIALGRRRRQHAANTDDRWDALNELGLALWTLGEREIGTARLEDAVAAFRAALAERNREQVPLDWAKTQVNLGNALQTLGKRETGVARLEEAVAAYRAALGNYVRDWVPLEWAWTQSNLGAALRTLGGRESGTARLEEAVAAYRAALEVCTRERVPLLWAETQMSLGIALRTLGERESGTVRLEAAVAACRSALEETTREKVPLDWAMTQTNLGIALWTLGERESGTARLEEAVAVCDAALAERTRERVPLAWATSTGNQGVALRVLAERTGDLAVAQRARDQIAAAEATLREGGHAPGADYYAAQLVPAEALVARLSQRSSTKVNGN